MAGPEVFYPQSTKHLHQHSYYKNASILKGVLETTDGSLQADPVDLPNLKAQLAAQVAAPKWAEPMDISSIKNRIANIDNLTRDLRTNFESQFAEELQKEPPVSAAEPKPAAKIREAVHVKPNIVYDIPLTDSEKTAVQTLLPEVEGHGVAVQAARVRRIR